MMSEQVLHTLIPYSFYDIISQLLLPQLTLASAGPRFAR